MIRGALRGLLNRVRRRWTRGERRATGPAEVASGAATQAHPTLGAGRGSAEPSVGTPDDVEEVDRLVDLTFGALLRRKPDRETVLAYRAGFANGTTFHDLIDDVIGSDEYRIAKQRLVTTAPVSGTTPGPEGDDDLPGAVALLTDRLLAKGWRPQVGLPGAERDQGDVDKRRMHSLRVTLAVLDRL